MLETITVIKLRDKGAASKHDNGSMLLAQIRGAYGASKSESHSSVEITPRGKNQVFEFRKCSL